MGSGDAWDDELIQFEAEGAELPPDPVSTGLVECDGARIWHAVYGHGRPVVLLHGGLGHSGNWGRVVPGLVAQGQEVLVVDSRGHGRSSRDERPYSYLQMAHDVRAVLAARQIPSAALVGWSDGACTALVLASLHPELVEGVLFFGCNMDGSGTKTITDWGTVIPRCFSRHQKDYQALSATPEAFEAFADAVGLMQRTQPEYTADQIAAIDVPVTVVHAEGDEFIRPEHADYLARTLPQGRLAVLPGVSHFAPLQRPGVFLRAVAEFLGRLPPHQA